MLFLLLSLVGCREEKESVFGITSLSSTTGPTTGGTSITINGEGFTFINGVDFGSDACTSVLVVSSSKITCTIPAHAEGAVQVKVYGDANRTATATYTYTSTTPTISTFTPSVGPLTGGTPININGTGFLAGASVTVGGSVCTSVSILSSTSLTCLVPAKSAGSYTVVVTNLDGLSATAGTTYSYQITPIVNSVSPTSGVLAGGGTLTISGSNFVTGASVRIGATPCTSVNVVSSTSITCVLPLKTIGGYYSVAVINPNLRSGTLGSAYLYRSLPTIGAVSPAFGALAGNLSITISGTGFM
ncbi:MAG: IPT/TIG domain-containing protein, partial [Bdellovibrionales bacterium]|nr:IPT/TIG domain-containing protein [Bdellovibrionales bacterium]